MPNLSLQNLTKRFGSIRAVSDLTLDVPDGALVALLGPSGCGKTTALRLVAGFLPPDTGTISLGGRVLSAPGMVMAPEEREMAMIFQSFALWPHMTVYDNVAYGLRVRGLPKIEMIRRTSAALAVVRLLDQADRYPQELSGGQQQRVALARALVVEPKTLLLDEPLSNLDPSLRDELRYEIRRLHETVRTTTLYVTHDQVEAMTAADLVVVMRAGCIEQLGTPQEIYERPHSAFVAQFLGGANILFGTVLPGGGVQVGPTTIRVSQPLPVPVGGSVQLAVRYHRIRLVTPSDATNGNRIQGRVLRHTYLGAVRDVMIEIPGGQQLRLMADLQAAPALHETVELEIAPDAVWPMPVDETEPKR